MRLSSTILEVDVAFDGVDLLPDELAESSSDVFL